LFLLLGSFTYQLNIHHLKGFEKKMPTKCNLVTAVTTCSYCSRVI
jgi:hypothetical protein